jgi:hypothetical protein
LGIAYPGTSACRNAHRSSMWSVHYCCLTVTKILLCLQILVKLASVRFHEYPFCGSQVVTWGCINRHAWWS